MKTVRELISIWKTSVPSVTLEELLTQAIDEARAEARALLDLG